jgi:phosphoribosylformimino-5-aminoimidazole carboxamide ribotide isomerase
MEIIPAIDLQAGRCVRLAQGAFERATVYDVDPFVQARRFKDQGARWLHVVDLDGARAGAPQQHALIADIARESGLATQVGGGLRDEQGVAKLLDAGIARVVVGSLAVKDPARVQRWLSEFGAERIVLALDVRISDAGVPEVLTDGWCHGSGRPLDALLGLYAGAGLKNVLCTDISRDGMLQGVNIALYTALRRAWPQLDIQASGGVAGLADVEQLAALRVAGVVMGKALYEGRIDLPAALKASLKAAPKVDHAG